MADETPGQQPLKPRKLTPRTGPGVALWYVLGLLLLVAAGQTVYLTSQSGLVLSYSEFKLAVREGRVQEITVGEDRVRGTFKAVTQGKRTFTAVRIEDPKLVEDLEAFQLEHQIELSGARKMNKPLLIGLTLVGLAAALAHAAASRGRTRPN